MSGVVLVVAGLDPSGGAGLVADVATVGARGLRAAGLATALTVQDTNGCDEAVAVPADHLRRAATKLVDDLAGAIRAVKIGMVATAANAALLADVIAPLAKRGVPIVLDPVLRATVGSPLLDDEDAASALGPLVAHATLVTPNLEEAEQLTPFSVRDGEGMAKAAAALRRAGARAALVKGLVDGELASDLLDAGAEAEWLIAERVRFPGPTPHGTGCALSTEIACSLAEGAPLRDAVRMGHARLQRRLRAARAVGKGRPLLGL